MRIIDIPRLEQELINSPEDIQLEKSLYKLKTIKRFLQHLIELSNEYHLQKVKSIIYDESYISLLFYVNHDRPMIRDKYILLAKRVNSNIFYGYKNDYKNLQVSIPIEVINNDLDIEKTITNL